MNIGLSEENVANVSKALNEYLADLYVLVTKTKNYHWNMKGQNFYPYHKMLQEQYEALDEAIDEVAERIVMVGSIAHGTLKEFSKKAVLKEHPGDVPAEKKMIQNLKEDHEQMVKSLRESIALCQANKDEGSADLLIKQIQFHEKSAWMLRSSLEK